MTQRERIEASKKQACLTILDKALAALADAGPMRASDLGWQLWGKTTKSVMRGTGSHGQNKFCRPAGKILKRLENQGLVRAVHQKHSVKWQIASKSIDL